MPGEEPESRSECGGWEQKEQQTTQQCQLQAAAVSFLSVDREVPVDFNSQAVPRYLASHAP